MWCASSCTRLKTEERPRVRQIKFGPNQTADEPLTASFPVHEHRGRPAMVVVFEVKSIGDLTEPAVTWRPTVGYSEICREEPPAGELVCGPPPATLEQTIGAGWNPARQEPPPWSCATVARCWSRRFPSTTVAGF